MVNVNKLRGKIKEKGESVETVARAIGINPTTFYRKLRNDGKKITIKQADDITRFLGLDPIEATAIFFSQHVA